MVAFEHARQGGHVMVAVGRVDDVLVNLVRDHEGIERPGQVGDGLQFFQGENLPRGVGRIAQYDGFGALFEGGTQLGRIEIEFRGVQGHVDRFGAAEDCVGAVVLVVGRKDDYLVAGIAGRHHGRHHGLGAAAGDHHMGVGVQVDPHPVSLLVYQGLAKAGRSPGDGVLMGPLGHGAFAGGKHLGRRIGVGKSLGKIDGVILIGHAGHLADNGLGEAGQTVGGFRHGCSFVI